MHRSAGPPSAARRVASVGGVAAVAAGGIAVTTAWATATTPERLWEPPPACRSLGNGPAATGRRARRLGLHLLLEPPVHAHQPLHVGRPRGPPLERAVQPVDRPAPAGGRRPRHHPSPTACCACSASRPTAVATARGVNLIYQFWIHTEAIDRIGRAEPRSTRRPTTGSTTASNRQYLDRNHGGILIIWDRMFGTFEPEDEPVVYGLTTNIDTFNPARIATPRVRRHGPGHRLVDRLGGAAVLRVPGTGVGHAATVACGRPDGPIPARRPPGLQHVPPTADGGGPVTAAGTKDDPWELTTPRAARATRCTATRSADPPALVCQVGSTTLTYRAIGRRGPPRLVAGAG